MVSPCEAPGTCPVVNEPINTHGPEQRGLLISLASVGQQVRLSLGRIISPPTELDCPGALEADVQPISCTRATPAPRAA